MSVNGIELAVGQQWTTKEYGVVTLDREGVSEVYPWRAMPAHISITPDGKYWDDDEEPILLECIHNPTQQQLKQSNPKPGDKIICNNGEEFVCCTLETLNNFGITPTRVFKEGTIFGKGNNELASWMYWSGVEYPREFNWEIKEIIPAQQEVKQYVTEDTPAQGDNTVGAVFQEKTYTLQQIKEAFYILQWREDALETFISKLNEPQDSAYKLYLELKAKFEGKE